MWTLQTTVTHDSHMYSHVLRSEQQLYTVRGKILEWEKIGELWAIRQYFTRQLFLLKILLATEVTKQLATF